MTPVESPYTVPHSFWLKPTPAPNKVPQPPASAMRQQYAEPAGVHGPYATHPQAPRYPPPGLFLPMMVHRPTAAYSPGRFYDGNAPQRRRPSPSVATDAPRAFMGQRFGEQYAHGINSVPKEDQEAVARLRRRKRSEKDRVKRPMNSFLIFSNEVRPILQAKYKDRSNAQISKLIGERWHNMDPARKKKYIIEAEKIKEEFSKKHPDYVYTKRKRKKRRRTKAGTQILQAQNLLSAVVPSPDSGNAQSPLLSLANTIGSTNASTQPLLTATAPSPDSTPLKDSTTQHSEVEAPESEKKEEKKENS